jgi:hypothetical protein
MHTIQNDVASRNAASTDEPPLPPDGLPMVEDERPLDLRLRESLAALLGGRS